MKPLQPIGRSGAALSKAAAGQPSASVVPVAISNTVFNATGARLRSVSFTPDKMKVALQRT